MFCVYEQNEYKRGISGWNFNLDDMKAQASLVPMLPDSHLIDLFTAGH